METNNQQTQTATLDHKSELPLQANASFMVGQTIFSMRSVLMSLDKDTHLRIYKQPDGSDEQAAFNEIVLDIAPETVKNVYVLQTVLVVKIPGRTCRFDLSGGKSVSASLKAIGGNVAIPAGGMAGIVQMESLIDELPLDLWLEAMQEAGFPVKRSKYNDFQNKWILTFVKGILAAFVIFIVYVIVMFVTGKY